MNATSGLQSNQMLLKLKTFGVLALGILIWRIFTEMTRSIEAKMPNDLSLNELDLTPYRNLTGHDLCQNNVLGKSMDTLDTADR